MDIGYKLKDIKTANYEKFKGVVKSIRVKFNNSNTVLNVPLSNDNSDYADLMKQVDAGELTIEDAD
tara:strand:- start:864 stop:1061 length:198 start_codon:yes stop_codon:yes gene_type:complete